MSIAGPVIEHHRAQGSMDTISALLTALPQLGEEPVETMAAAPPEAPEAVAATSTAAEEPTAVEFVDEESDLIEIVDIEGELAAPPAAEEPAPVVEEFAVDFGADLGGAEAVAEPPVAEPPVVEPSVIEPPVIEPPAAAEAPVMEPVIPPPPVAEEIQVEVQPPPPLVPPVEHEVADELVEITDSFVGPSMGDLEQLDFFLDQELYEDAARVLSKLEEEHGEDPEVVERRLKLKEVGVLLEQLETVEEGAEELFADEEQYIDLAKELEAELAAEEAMVEEATGRGKGEAILEEVFKEFQKGVAEQLSEEDSDTHFNLGIAYREMGLLPEAIREFQVASRDTAYFVESCSIIGVCYQEQGMWSEAAEWYQKALVAPDISEDARLGLRYDLAAAYESSGDVEQARGIFGEILAANPAYRDVSDRLSVLTEQRQAN